MSAEYEKKANNMFLVVPDDDEEGRLRDLIRLSFLRFSVLWLLRLGKFFPSFSLPRL